MDFELKVESGSSPEPHTVREFHERGWIFLTAGDYPKAEDDFRAAISRNSRFAEAYYGLGIVLKRQNRLAEAREAFEKSIALLGMDVMKDDQVRASMLRRLAQDHLKVLAKGAE